jgi:hypothetical protein
MGAKGRTEVEARKGMEKVMGCTKTEPCIECERVLHRKAVEKKIIKKTEKVNKEGQDNQELWEISQGAERISIITCFGIAMVFTRIDRTQG